MGRHYKKPAVTPEIRRQWFTRHIKDGETLSHIATVEGYDIRTVKKIIAEEREAHERREARGQVLRNAMEQHYKDLCNFARELDNHLKREAVIPTTIRENRMWGALKEHLPRSPIWKSVDQWDRLIQEIVDLEAEVKAVARGQLLARSPVGFAEGGQEVGLSSTAADPVVSNLNVSARGSSSLLGPGDVHLTPASNGRQAMQVGAFGIGMIPEDLVGAVQEVIVSLLAEVTAWPQRDKMERLLAELGRTRRVLQDELAVIILRRIVPGRCKYCPL